MMFRLAARLRLGLPVNQSLPARCACGKPMDESHLLACKYTRGGSLATRHNALVSVLSKLCHDFNLHVVVEPYAIQHQHHQRPDLSIRNTKNELLYIDVSVINPAAPSYTCSMPYLDLATSGLN